MASPFDRDDPPDLPPGEAMEIEPSVPRTSISRRSISANPAVIGCSRRPPFAFGICNQLIKINMLELTAQDFAMTHRGIEAEGDKQPATWIVVSQRALKKRLCLLVGQSNNSSLFAF